MHTRHQRHRAEAQLSALKPWQDRAIAISPSERLQRLARARALMLAKDVDALLIVAGASLRYFTGISWAMSERLVALMLPQTGRAMIVAPTFERGSLLAELQIDADVIGWEEHENPFMSVVEALRLLSIKRFAVDPQTPWFVVNGLVCAGAPEILDGAPVIDHCRMHKSSNEIALIQQAMSMTMEVHRQAAMFLEPGVTTSEVKRFIDDAHRALGADGGSTFCAVQFGKTTAYPHGLPGAQQLAANDLVLIDTGCTVDGYNSDITRTYVTCWPIFGRVES